MNEYKNYKNKSKTIRLSDSAVSDIKYISKKENISESELVRSFLENSINSYKLKKAIKAVRDNVYTISEASKFCGLTYKEFYNKLIESKVLDKEENKIFTKKEYNNHLKDILK